MSNIYISFLILGFGKSKQSLQSISVRYKQSIKGISRIINLIIQIYQFWIQNLYTNWEGTNLIYLDGLCKMNKMVQISEIYQMIQVCIIQYIIGKDNTIQISKRPELFQMLITNLISQIQQQNSNDFIITIITWEQMNQSQYLQVSMQGNTDSGTSQSAGIKYFQQSAQTTAFMQMGISLIYSKTGSVNYEIQISMLYIINISPYDFENFTQYLGFLMIILTIMFKQGASPFHFWAPDLYDSLPTPILIYIMIVPKIAILIFLYLIMPIINQIITFTFINIIAIFCVIIGSIGLISQWRIKRFLTYSAISHIGFILFAYITYSWDYYFYYIFIYGLTNLLIFQIIQSISSNFKGNDDDIVFIKEQYGIFKMNPFLAIIFSLAFFSQAGIPPQIGFFQKFQIQQGIIENFKIHQTFIIIIGSIISTINYILQIKNCNFNFNFYSYKTKNDKVFLKKEINESKILLKKTGKIFKAFQMESIIIDSKHQDEDQKEKVFNQKDERNFMILSNYLRFKKTNLFIWQWQIKSKNSIRVEQDSILKNLLYISFQNQNQETQKEAVRTSFIYINVKNSNSYIISQLSIILFYLLFKFNLLNILIENIYFALLW